MTTTQSMTDIVERLRGAPNVMTENGYTSISKMGGAMLNEAAEEIERLRGLIDKHINEKAELKQGMIDILEYLSAVQIAEVNIKHIARKALGEIPDAALKEGE